MATAVKVLILGNILDMIGSRNDSSTPSLRLVLFRLLYLSNILSANFPPNGVPISPAVAAAIPNQYAAD